MLLEPGCRRRRGLACEQLGDDLRGEGEGVQSRSCQLSEVGGPVSGAAMLYVRDTHADTLSTKLGPEKWAEAEDADIDVYALCVARVNDGSLTVGEPRVRSIFAPEALRVSPLGTSIAFVAPSAEHDKVLELYVWPVDGSAMPRLVAAPVAMFTDWSAT